MSIRQNRRTFLETAGFTAATVGGSGWLSYARAAEDKKDPDLIVINAKVTTMDGGMPRAEAFAVLEGRFMAVGSTTDIKSLAGPRTRVYDAKGMMVTPGFNDTHDQAPGEYLLYGVVAGNPYEVEIYSIQRIIDILKARAAKTPPGQWIDARCFDDTKLKDGRPITIADLDKASTQHPISLGLRGGHATYYNSYAFQHAGVTKNTPNPPGGVFEKDARGELSGRVTDRAANLLDKAGTHETFSPAEEARRRLAGVEYMSKKFVQYGVTSVGQYANALPQLQEARAKGTLLHRVSHQPGGELLEGMIKVGIKSGFGDEWLNFGPAQEHQVDGGWSSRTCSMYTPYVGVSPPFYGDIVETQDATNAWVERVHRAGIRPNCHCNGAPAVDHVATAFERALKLFPMEDVRPVFSHCSIVTDAAVRRIKAMNGLPSVRGGDIYYNADKFKFYGADVAEHTYIFRNFLNAGVKVSTGSDFVPGPFDPLMAIQGMVTRKGFNGEVWGGSQKVTVDEAILINTLYGAYSSKEENIKGSISPGKLADYVVLSDDLHAIDPEKIMGVKIVQTVVGGMVRYQA